MYRWSSTHDLASACASNGWTDVVVDEVAGVPSILSSAEDIGEALEVPASKATLRSLAPAQRAALRDYLEQRAREVFGEGEVRLPRQAWLARGRVSA
jgi:hypothetical protein